MHGKGENPWLIAKDQRSGISGSESGSESGLISLNENADPDTDADPDPDAFCGFAAPWRSAKIHG
jgi:hypothetical protein